MADQSHLKLIIEEGVNAWNEWIGKNPKINADLSDANLRGARLNNANLREADLSGARLSGADLSEADLREANLYCADLRGADLRGANLNRAHPSGAHLNGADLSWADLSKAILGGANLSGANLSNAKLNRADLSGANLSRAILREADMRGANLSELDLSGADLSEADLSGADLCDAYLRRANLNKANLSMTDLSEADLNGADLNGADLNGANLSGVKLSGAKLNKADQSGANKRIDMNRQEKIISRLADRQCKWICEDTIAFLQKTTEGMQSGEDSSLKNLWDEVCAQVQFQESMFWDYYLDYIQTIISKQLKGLNAITCYAIWLQTGAGEEFLFDYEEHEEYGNPIDALEHIYDENDILNHILNNYVLPEAANATNARIEKYLS